MAFVDFTDPEDMFDLLIDYLTDARSEAADPSRRRFLSALLGALGEMQDDFTGMNPARQSASLRALQRSLEPEFADDPVAQHLEDCAAELERLSERES